MTHPPTVTGINRYPIKSCRGEPLSSAVVEPCGLAGDRRWMLVDDDGMVVTARKHPQLVLVTPEPTDGGLLLRAPDLPPLHVSTPDGSALTDVRVFRDPAFAAAPAEPEAHAWFGKVTGASVRLVHLDDPTRRHPNPAYSRDEDRVSFADGYPVHLTTEESLAAINDLIATGRHPQEGPLPIRRFRPNLVAAGAPAWAEDRWRLVRIGDVTFRAVKATNRCVLTLIDPDTAVKGKEPLATLARHRRWEGMTWFGVHLITDTPGATVRVGAGIEVLAEVDDPDPQR